MARTGTGSLLALVGCAALVLGGCGLMGGGATTPPRQLQLNRDTPEKAYEYFKEMARANQTGAEWDTFSPNFKRMLNQAVGRNVDLGDYNLARGTVATNSQADMQLLLNSTLVGVQYTNDARTEALVTISAGGKSISPKFVRLTRWEVQLKGEDDPYTDFVSSAGQVTRIGPDGSITVMIRPPQYTADFLRSVRPEQVDAVRVEAQWYVDDFGGLDALVGESAAGEGTQQPAPQPTPQPRPREAIPGTGPSPTPLPPSGGGFGSPDGSPPTGFGSPDGGSSGGFGSPDGSGFGSPDG